MGIKPIGHYSMENPATIFDEEALTALQLAARTAAKVNEVVTQTNETRADCDKLIEDTNDRLDTFQNDTIPNVVAGEVNDHIRNGDFDDQIDKHTSDVIEQIDAIEASLGSRLDNLLGSVTTGTTTMDAEVIDLRTDINGKSYASAGEAVRAQVGYSLTYGGDKTSAGWDFNEAELNTFGYVASTNAANAPEANDGGFTFGFLETFSCGGVPIQLFHSFNTTSIYRRWKDAVGGWVGWAKNESENHKSRVFAGSNIAEQGWDFNDAPENVFCYVGVTNAQNTPDESATKFTFGLLNTYKCNEATFQVFHSFNTGGIHIRYLAGGAWTPWIKNNPAQQTVVTVSTAEELYNTVRNMGANTHVKINAGVYDISRFIDADENAQMTVKEGCIIEGLGDVKILCNKSLPSSVPSIFKLGRGDCELINLHMVGSNIRYIVHDDTGGIETAPATHKITNCVMEYTGDGWASFDYPRCIGGGTGNNVVSIIEGCVLKDKNTVCIDYHTNFSVLSGNQPTHEGKVIIKNCYSETGRINFDSLGGDNGNHPVMAIVTNNCMKGDVTHDGNAVVVRAWNNVTI